MRRCLLTFGTLWLLWALVSHANHELSGLRIHLFIGGLFVVFPALQLDRRPGLLAVFAAGLLFDTYTPAWFGLHAVLFSAAHTVLFHFRGRIPKDEPLIGILVALLANLGIFLLLSFFVLQRTASLGNPWNRLFVDLLASQAVVTLVTPWFLALQKHLLVLGGGLLPRTGTGQL